MIYNSYAEKQKSLAGIKLVSCGHIFAEPKREINRPQGRDDWLLFYIAKESETFFLDKTVIAEAGSFIIFAPKEKQHHIYNGNATAEFFFIHFQCDALPEEITLETSRVYSMPPQKRVVSIFEEIIEETLSKRPNYEILCISQLLYLFSLIQRNDAEISNSQNKGWNGIARAIQHMNRYCDQNLKLEDYASMCHMSKYHFLRVFKAVTGITPLEYRNRIRIDHAKELLKNSNFSISEIGESLGYSSLAYFSTAFKKATGFSPTEYCTLQ